MAKLVQDRRLWLVTIVAFVVMLALFDKNNLIERVKVKSKIHDLEQQQSYYLDRIAQDSTILKRLKEDDVYLESYAREHYHFKRTNETVYIVR